MDTVSSIEIRPGNAQAQGRRSEQQDAFGFGRFDDPAFLAHGGYLAVLADGMGGMLDGREAARRAVLSFIDSYSAKPPEEDITAALERALQAANREVYALATAGAGEGECGTTLVAAVVLGQSLYWTAVGDSRLYHFELPTCRLRQLSADHDYARDLASDVASGRLTPEQADTDPYRDALTSFLGLAEIPEIDRCVEAVPLAAGDRVLLCSDGVYRALAVDELVACLGKPAQEVAEQVIARVTDAADPYQDNATVAVLAVEAEVGAAPPRTATRSSVRHRRRVRPIFSALLVLVALLAVLYHGWLREHGPFPFDAPLPVPEVTPQPPRPPVENPSIEPEPKPWEKSAPTSSAAPATPTSRSPTRP